MSVWSLYALELRKVAISVRAGGEPGAGPQQWERGVWGKTLAMGAGAMGQDPSNGSWGDGAGPR